MPKGKVKWFNEIKGFGFIRQENGPDIFVHYSDIRDEGYRTLEEGMEVEFELIKGDNRFRAVNVIKK